MSTSFYGARNNVSSTVAAPGYTAGAGSLVVVDGSGFKWTDGSLPSATKPILVSTFLADGTPEGIYRCEGRSGNTLTLTAMLSGTDASLPTGSKAEMRPCAEHAGQIAAAINTLEALSYNVRAYGAIGDGVANDTAAIQTALDAADAAGGGTVLLPPGTYKIGTSITKYTANPIAIEAMPGAILDGSSSTASALLTLGGGAVSLGGRLANVALGADVARGAITITVSGLTLATGDILLLSTDTYCLANPGNTSQLWNPNQAGSYKGEMVEVESVSGSTITLRSVLWDSYTAATTTVYKLRMPRVRVRGMEIRRSSNHMGLVISYARDVEVRGCKITGARERCFGFFYGFGGWIEDNTASDFWYSGSGTSYGIAMDTVRDFSITNNRVSGGRCALKHGGYEPTRNVIATENTFDNYHATNLPCVDYHWNCEGCELSHNTILNSVGPACRNLKITENLIIVDSATAAIDFDTEVNSDYLEIRGNVILAANSTRYGIFIRNNSPNLTHADILIADNVGVAGLAPAYGIFVTSYTGVGLMTINNLLIRHNRIPAGTAYGLAIFPGASSTLAIGRTEIAGGRYRSAALRGIYITSLTTPGPVTIKDAWIQSSTAGQPALSTANLVDILLWGCRIESTVAANSTSNAISGTGNVRAIQNTFVNWAANSGLAITGGTVLYDGNTFDGCSGTVSATGTQIYTRDGTGNLTLGGVLTATGATFSGLGAARSVFTSTGGLVATDAAYAWESATKSVALGDPATTVDRQLRLRDSGGAAIRFEVGGSFTWYVGPYASGSAFVISQLDKTIGNYRLLLFPSGNLTLFGDVTMTDAKNFVLNATTGTKVGTATTQKLAFWNATPIAQPAGAAQAAVTDSTTGTPGSSLVDVGSTHVQTTLNNNFSTLWALQNAMRSALVNAGLMKGSA